MWGLKNVLFRRYDALSRVSWREFEHLMARHYRDKGYRVEHVGTGGRKKKRFDGGIDLKLYRDGEYTRAALIAAAKIPELQIIDGNAVRAMLDPARGPTAAPVDGDARFFDEALSWTVNGRSRPSLWPRLVIALVAIPIVLAILFQAAMTVQRVASHPVGGRPSSSAPDAVPVQVSDRRPGEPSIVARARMPSVSAPQATNYQSDPMTESELKDWKRRNAESMKIIEKTTPEI